MSGETHPEPSWQTLALERIDSAPFQIRQSIDEEGLRELATSARWERRFRRRSAATEFLEGEWPANARKIDSAQADR